MAYIDLNPVRAGLAESAEDFSWSSYKHLAGQSIDKLVTPHALYWGLGNTPFAREAAYAEFVAGGLSVATQKALTESALKGRVVGRPDFLTSLEKNTQRQILPQKAGRPFKKLPKAWFSIKKLDLNNYFFAYFDLSLINWLFKTDQINVDLTPINFLGFFVAMQYALFPAKYL